MAISAGTAYVETFGCRWETAEGDDHDGDHEWGFSCGTCRRWLGVGRSPCPDHAPMDIPGLQRAECSAPPGTHPVTFFYANDGGYGAPCMYCAFDAISKDHAGCEHSHHGAWRSWRVTGWADRAGAQLGLWIGFTHVTWSASCDGCRTRFRWGPRFWILGVRKDTLAHVLRRGHRPMPGFGDVCNRCSPEVGR